MIDKSENKIINAWICQVEGRNMNPIFGDVEILDGKINKIIKKKFNEYNFELSSASDNVYDAGGRFLTLPFINFHDHIYSRLAKGLSITGQIKSFQDILNSLWWKMDMLLDLEMVSASAGLASIQSIQNGVTYLFDHHASPSNTAGSLQVIKNVLAESGLRAVLCFEVSDRNGMKYSEDGLNENFTFFKKHQDNDFKSMIGLHASFTIGDETLGKISRMMEDSAAGIHIHLCEDESDNKISMEKFNGYPVDRLNKFNLMNDKSILAHGVHLKKDDYKIIAESGSAVVYNLDSNMNNSVGIPLFSQMPAQVTVLLGTDGMHANIAKSFKNYFLHNRMQGESFNKAFSTIIKSYFDQIELASKYFPDFPSLQTGDRADMVIWDYLPPTPVSSENFWGHFIYGLLESRAKTVIQNGNFLLKDFYLKNNDIQKIFSNISEQGNRLFNKFNIS